MKITVINKASTIRKPQNFCPWIVRTTRRSRNK